MFMMPYRGMVDRYLICGSYRRGKEDIGDIDLVVQPKGLEFSCALQKDFGINWSLTKKSILLNGAQLEILVCTEVQWGAMIMYATGPGEFNIGMRRKAKAMGLKLNQYGIWTRLDEKCLASRTEEEMFECLGMKYQSPSARSPM